jgi:uncharacterized protein (DUF1778 family)
MKMPNQKLTTAKQIRVTALPHDRDLIERAARASGSGEITTWCREKLLAAARVELGEGA